MDSIQNKMYSHQEIAPS